MITGLALAAVPLHGAEPPAGTIAFSSLAPRGWDLYVTDVKTLQSRRLTDHPALDYNGAFSPDGQSNRLRLGARRQPGTICHRGRTAPGLRRLTDDFALDDHPAFSPDGKHLAFVSTRQPAAAPGQAWNAIYVMNADGSGVKRLSPVGRGGLFAGLVAPGGLDRLCLGERQGGGHRPFVMKPDGSGRRLVVKNGGWPSFAADGQSLFFHSQRQGKWGVWRVNLDGSNLKRITPPDLEAFTPRASVDGKWLVLARLRGEHRQIELMDLSTGKLTALTTEATDHWNPAISPDGRQVVYHQSHPRPQQCPTWSCGERRRGPILSCCAWQGRSRPSRRTAGAWPWWGDLARLDVMNIDGSSRKTLYTGRSRGLFSTSWAHQGDQIAFAVGGVFQGAGAAGGPDGGPA